MKVEHTHCAGLDVHKKTVEAAIIIEGDSPCNLHKEVKTFGTMTKDLLSISDWLQSHKVSIAAMESTGEYWKPIWNILENNFELLLVNAQHIKHVPGRKTDVKDSEWIAELLRHGLLRPSFVPPAGQRELRELTRHRANFVRERASMVNRLQKTLESANIKMGDVVSDVMGISSREILAAIVAGQVDPDVMAELSRGKMRLKREQLTQALTGTVKAHHRFVLSELLCQIDCLEETIARFDEEIIQYSFPFKQAIELLDTIPGIARRNAEVIVSEIGTNMRRFPTANHLAAWAGVAPGNNESAGKRLSGARRKGNHSLVVALVQSANAASHQKNTYLSALFHRIAARRGRKRAIIAVAHAILISIFYMLTRNEPYEDLGSDYFDRQKPEATARRLLRRLERLGLDVSSVQVPVVI
jgi:transposase